jgi:hypothetical protein
MAEVIQFPVRGETRTVHFVEVHPFGEIGGLRLSLVQEKDQEDSPFVLVLGGADGFQILETFSPTSDGRESGKVAGDIAMRALITAHGSWSGLAV